MSKLDKAKEKMGFYKLWLGVFIAVFVSVAGWGVSNLKSFDENFYLFISAFLLEIILFVGIFIVNKKMLRLLKEIEKL